MPFVRTGLIAGGGLLTAAAIGAGVYGVLTADPPEPVVRRGPVATPFISPGKVRPPTVSVAEARLPDDELVIGVVAGGRARAYRVSALVGISSQVVNDVVGGVPVTVTHCNQTGCSRVFTGDGHDPLPILIGGYMDGLLLMANGRFYRQSDGQAPAGGGFPYPPMDFQEVTWTEWRAAHPDTDVYVGDPPPKPASGKAN